jgi:ATP-binding cassette, subfamily B, bacterial
MKIDVSVMFKRLWALVATYKVDVRALYMHTILGALIQISLPLGIQSIVSFSQGATMVTSIYVLIVLIVLGVAMVGVMQILQMRIIEKIQQQIFVHYAFEFAEKIPQFDLLQKDNYYLPEKTNCFLDTAIIQKGIAKLLLDVPTAIFQILVSLVLLSIYSNVFIIAGIILVVMIVVILRMTLNRGITTCYAESKYKYNVVAWLEEIARTIRSFKYSQGTHLNLKKTDEQVLGYITSRTDHFKILLVQFKSIVVFKTILTAIMLIIGVYLLVNQEINIGEFIASEIVILTIISAVEKLIVSIENVYDVVVGLDKLASVTESKLDESGQVDLDPGNKGLQIQFDNVYFNYPNTKSILNGFSTIINANQKVGIIGDESAGKATILKLITGNYNSFEGHLAINGMPIQNYSLVSLRQNIGVYFSDVDIFSGSLYDNITMGNANIKHQHIVNLANEMGFNDFLFDFKLGFDTHIHPLGQQLSSSQIKCILLLRAFANNPKLLLLNEPWLGLDAAMQLTIQNYILTKIPNVTVVIVTSDKEFLSKCNKQIVVKYNTN